VRTADWGDLRLRRTAYDETRSELGRRALCAG